MKSQTKKNTIQKRKTRKATNRLLSKVDLVHSNNSKFRHFRLVSNKHTGVIIHFRHTSHLALTIILLMVGLFMVAGSYVVSAVDISGSVSVGVVVNGPAPTIGAVILSPTNGQEYKDISSIAVSGTCQSGTFVSVGNNGIPVGTTICDSEGKFFIEIQLFVGANSIIARNYDNANQSGPDTPSVNIVVTKTQINPVEPEIPIVKPITPEKPDNPSIIPGDTNIASCNDYKTSGILPVGGEPHVVIICMPRLFLPNTIQQIGLLIWGGTPPYAISIDLGDSNQGELLLSVVSPGYKTVSLQYAFPNYYKITTELKDSKGKGSIVKSTIQVSGSIVNNNGSLDDRDILSLAWFKTPVPLYLLAVAITLGFWSGDLFDRRFGASKKRPKRRAA